ncbi:MAG: hypothetical protein B6245_17535 [Desulfobacteraceae bacterium 4572_88]|nr:MAG: hypothetical protein B6245_17535 [Desulfobacteraceae bacterium 4572_88]
MIFLFALLQISAPLCRADSPIIPPAPGHPSEDRPKLPDYLPKEPDKGLNLPPSPGKPPSGPRSGGISFELKGVLFEGNTVFTDEVQ